MWLLGVSQIAAPNQFCLTGYGVTAIVSLLVLWILAIFWLLYGSGTSRCLLVWCFWIQDCLPFVCVNNSEIKNYVGLTNKSTSANDHKAFLVWGGICFVVVINFFFISWGFPLYLWFSAISNLSFFFVFWNLCILATVVSRHLRCWLYLPDIWDIDCPILMTLFFYLCIPMRISQHSIVLLNVTAVVNNPLRKQPITKAQDIICNLFLDQKTKVVVAVDFVIVVQVFDVTGPMWILGSVPLSVFVAPVGMIGLFILLQFVVVAVVLNKSTQSCESNKPGTQNPKKLMMYHVTNQTQKIYLVIPTLILILVQLVTLSFPTKIQII